MEVNFREVKVYLDLEKKVERVMNLQKDTADAIYAKGTGAMGSSMANRVYEAKDGIVELNEYEVEHLRQVLNRSDLFVFAVEGLRRVLNEGGNVEETKKNKENKPTKK